MSMELNDLTMFQKRYLRSLLYSHMYYESPICAKLIAEKTNRHVSTVRRHMQSLIHMKLAESISGPNGGYKPTVTAYDLLGVDSNAETNQIVLQHNRNQTTISAVDLTIKNVDNMVTCRVELYIHSGVSQFARGDYIQLNLLPKSEFHIEGEIDMVNQATNQLLVDVSVLTCSVK